MAALQCMGGWVQLCGSTLDELIWKKKEFMGMYQNFENTPLDQLPSNLPGRTELAHHKNKAANEAGELMKGLDRHRAAKALKTVKIGGK